MESARRSGRAKKVSTSFVPIDQRWSVREKKALFEGLKKHGPNNLLALQTDCAPQRQIADIDNFLRIMKTKASKSAKTIVSGSKPESEPKQPPPTKIPIELWTAEAEALTRNEHDYSFILADVCSMFGSLEPHDKIPSADAPDWSAIYAYLASILHNEKPKSLKSVDALIVVDILESLAVDLKACKTSNQEQLMRQKYDLLTAPVIIHDKHRSQLRLKQALDEDTLHATSSVTPGGTGGIAVTPSKSQERANPVTTTTPSHTSETVINIDSSESSTSGQVPEIPQPSTSQVNLESTPTPKKNSVGGGDIRPKKTPLYTLNPFYIPVKYLPLR